MNHFNPDITGVLLDTDLGAQLFSIRRSEGMWDHGRFVSDVVELPAYGNIQPATPEELRQVPEGDRINGMLVIRTTSEVHMTNPDGASDEICWQGNMYKVLRVIPWTDYGFHEAYVTRK